MERQQQINIAAKDCATTPKGNRIIMGFSRRGKEFGFREGAKWADEHPNWISTKEQPCPHDHQILLLADNGLITTGHWDESTGRWRSSTDLLPPTQSIRADILYWMELPKKPEGIPKFNPKDYDEEGKQIHRTD